MVVGAYAPLAYALVNYFLPGWRKIDGGLRSFIRYLVMCILVLIVCFLVPIWITNSFMRFIGLFSSTEPPAEHALLRVFCLFGWLFFSMIVVACHGAAKGGLKKSATSTMSPERERLVGIILLMTMLPFPLIGASIGVSIVPYWKGGWDLVLKNWTAVGKPVELSTAVLGLLGIIGGFAVGYFLFRKMALSTGLLTQEEVRSIDDSLGKEGRTD